MKPKKNRYQLTGVFASCFLATAMAAPAAIILSSNGDFETGDTSGWTSFVGAPSTFGVTGDSSSGSFAGIVTNNTAPSGQVIKQANLGAGTVNPGDTVTITFDAKGTFRDGGVLFAEFFSEVSGGGTSSAEILSGGPLFLSDQATYVPFSFTVVAGADVSGGVTLQFNVATGGAPTSFAEATIDNVVVSVVPEPSSTLLCVLPLLGLVARRRR